MTERVGTAPPFISYIHSLSKEGRVSKEISSSLLQESSKVRVLNKIKAIPCFVAQFFRDSDYLNTVLNILNLISQISVLSDGEAIPLISLFLAPLGFYRTVINTKEQVQLMISAIKTKQVAHAFFFAFQAVDSCGNILGLLAKGANGTIQISAVKNMLATLHLTSPAAMVTVGLLFSLIIPVILIVVGAVGMLATGYALIRNLYNYPKFLQKCQDKDKYHRTFEILTSLKQRDSENLSDKKKVQLELYKTSLCLNDKHFKHIQKSIKTILKDKRALKKSLSEIKAEKLSSLNLPDGFKDIQDLYGELNVLYHSVLDEEVDFLSKFDQLLLGYDKLKKLAKQNRHQSKICKSLYFQIRNQEKELKTLKTAFEKNQAEGIRLIDEVQAEARRVIISNIVNLILATITLVAGIFALTHPNLIMIGTVSGSITGSIEIITIIFNKTISMKKWRDMELFLLKPHHQRNVPEST